MFCVKKHIFYASTSSIRSVLSGPAEYFGLGPYELVYGSLSVIYRMSSQMLPMMGIRAMSNIQPLFPTSWSLRTETARPGMKTATTYPTYKRAPDDTPIPYSRIAPTRMRPQAKRKLKRVNIQYSLRRALPLKSAYCRKTLRYHSIS